MEYLNPNKGDATWRIENKTENFLEGKFRHCIVALPGNHGIREKYNKKAQYFPKGQFINDVTTLRGRGQYFCDVDRI